MVEAFREREFTPIWQLFRKGHSDLPNPQGGGVQVLPNTN